jgi:hypothetical protein
MKNTSTGFTILAAAIGLMIFIRSEYNRAPYVPADDFHNMMMWTNAACSECHAPGKQTPLHETHPSKDQCLSCHKAKNAITGD